MVYLDLTLGKQSRYKYINRTRTHSGPRGFTKNELRTLEKKSDFQQEYRYIYSQTRLPLQLLLPRLLNISTFVLYIYFLILRPCIRSTNFRTFSIFLFIIEILSLSSSLLLIDKKIDTTSIHITHLYQKHAYDNIYLLFEMKSSFDHLRS